MWTYGGTFPGLTIRRRAGRRTEVTFHHELPAAAGELTIHLTVSRASGSRLPQLSSSVTASCESA